MLQINVNGTGDHITVDFRMPNYPIIRALAKCITLGVLEAIDEHEKKKKSKPSFPPSPLGPRY